MIRKIWYEAKDPYYSDEVQTFIGSTLDELDNQEYEHDKYLGRHHSAGIMYVFKKHTIYESDCTDEEREIFTANYLKMRDKHKETNQRTTI